MIRSMERRNARCSEFRIRHVLLTIPPLNPIHF
jgi:hypothetical protein